jgi:subtilisin family serine protease
MDPRGRLAGAGRTDTSYVVLRRPPKRTARRGGAKGTDDRDAPVAPRVDVDEMSPARAAALARESDVAAVAPPFLMTLVRPVPGAAGAAAPLSAPGPAWGVRAVGADTSPFTGAGVVVAVLDTGIVDHPAFAGVDLQRRDFTGGTDTKDLDGHGTHCAGILFGRDVDGVRIGVAPGVRRALVGKVLGVTGCQTWTVLKGIQWAVEQGAQVISMSLGIDFPGQVRLLVEDGLPGDVATSLALEGYRQNVVLFERLARLYLAENPTAPGPLLAAAAGNESRREEDPRFSIGVSPPAVAEGIVSVGALQESSAGLTVAPFSNVGPVLAAPGVGIVSAARGGGLCTMNGTSMATPFAAGVAALWAERMKETGSRSPMLLSSRLVGNATMEGIAPGVNPDLVGAGLVYAPQK